jgi:hypothetical protein
VSEVAVGLDCRSGVGSRQRSPHLTIRSSQRTHTGTIACQVQVTIPTVWITSRRANRNYAGALGHGSHFSNYIIRPDRIFQPEYL